MVGFVDDSNRQANSYYEVDTTATLQHMVHKAKENATIWSQLLQATGGAIQVFSIPCTVLEILSIRCSRAV
jgi:hypothetical protein